MHQECNSYSWERINHTTPMHQECNSYSWERYKHIGVLYQQQENKNYQAAAMP